MFCFVCIFFFLGGGGILRFTLFCGGILRLLTRIHSDEELKQLKTSVSESFHGEHLLC